MRVKPLIWIGLAGDGRAHAVRSLSLAKKLSDRYEVQLFSGGDGYDFLSKCQYPHLHKRECLRFYRGKRGKVRPIRSAFRLFKFFWKMHIRVKENLELAKERKKACGCDQRLRACSFTYSKEVEGPVDFD